MISCIKIVILNKQANEKEHTQKCNIFGEKEESGKKNAPQHPKHFYCDTSEKLLKFSQCKQYPMLLRFKS
jgi:hypothetical protein